MAARVMVIFPTQFLTNATFISAITGVIAGGKEWRYFISHLSFTPFDGEHRAQLKEHFYVPERTMASARPHQ